MTIIDLVLALHARLEEADLPHGFGGALALAYLTEPRGTVDVDVNVFAPVDDVDQVLAELVPLGLEPEAPRDTWMPAAGLRLRRPGDRFPVDVFLSLDDAYREIQRRVVHRPFGRGGEELPFLSAEDLVVFKLSFGRDKDWVDLRAIARDTPLDLAYVERQLLALRGPRMHPRLARIRQLVQERS